jgi:molybdopterin molybdotransferase
VSATNLAGRAISVEEYLDLVLDSVPVLPPFEQTLLDAQGCAVGADLTSPVDLPSFDNSAMDGYAVHADDIAGASAEQPVRLPVSGDIAAGADNAFVVPRRMAARIMTGAPLPQGADAVVPVELTDGKTVTVSVHQPVAPGSHVRRRGEDTKTGDVLVSSGTRLTARHIATLAAAGIYRVNAHPRPRVVVLSTGSELVAPGNPLGTAKIYDANSFALSALVRSAGAVAYRVGIVPDDPTELMAVLEDQLVRADLVLTSGGVSVGAYDVVKQVLSRLGTVGFYSVAMQPGKPQGFGTIGDDHTPIFTLPGNPVSAFVSFQVFVRPALRALQGLPPDPLPTVRARLTEPVTSPGGLRHYLRGALTYRDGAYEVAPAEGQGSHQIFALSSSNALIVVGEDETELAAGDPVDVMRLP